MSRADCRWLNEQNQRYVLANMMNSERDVFTGRERGGEEKDMLVSTIM